MLFTSASDTFVDNLHTLLIMFAIAASAPLLVGLLPRPKLPEVVLLLVGGIVVGPHLLNLVSSTHGVELFVELGLGFLFFVAGLEINPRILTRPAGKRAGVAWLVSMSLALVLCGLLGAAGVITAVGPLAVGLSTTAIGTLLPVLRDNGLLTTALGERVVAAGAVGEFGPLLAISLFLGTQGFGFSLLALLGLGLIGAAALVLPKRFVSERIRTIVAHGEHTSSQTVVRWTVVLMMFLLVATQQLGQDLVIGAFLAGAILRLYLPQQSELFTHKIEALAFGFFVPLFFVSSGIGLDLPAIGSHPDRVLVLFAGLALVRGLPTYLLHRRQVPDRTERTMLALYTATGLPLIIAVTAIGVSSGVMLPENAAALVGAGVLSVLAFPTTAEVLRRRLPS